MLLDVDIARVCHEANRALQIALDDPTIDVSPAWDDLDDHTVSSVIDGVRAHLAGDVSPEESHENWRQFKINDGWRWGPIKNLATKEHPLLVPYGELSEADKAKDSLFSSIVGALKPLAYSDDDLTIE